MTANPRFVVTGGPGSGKTTLLDALAQRGHHCVPEAGRALIQARKARGLSPRPELDQFGWDMLELDIGHYEATTDADGPLFFDRGVLDSVGFLNQYGQLSAAEVDAYVTRYRYNDRVFIAPPWPDIFENDDDRDQSFGESVEIHRTLIHWYERCGYTLMELPLTDVDERVEFVARHAVSV